jgi:hypothetical protein
MPYKMNIIKRLLNIFVLISVLIFSIYFYGVSKSLYQYFDTDITQSEACELKEQYLARESARLGQQAHFISYVDFGRFVTGPDLKLTDRELEERADAVLRHCDREIRSVYGGWLLGLAFIVLLITVVINYVLFGRFRVWNGADSRFGGIVVAIDVIPKFRICLAP